MKKFKTVLLSLLITVFLTVPAVTAPALQINPNLDIHKDLPFTFISRL
jgi:hypothetical protein